LKRHPAILEVSRMNMRPKASAVLWAALLCVTSSCGDDDGGPTGTSKTKTSCRDVSGPWVSNSVWLCAEEWCEVEIFMKLEQDGCQLTNELEPSVAGSISGDSVFVALSSPAEPPYLECRLELESDLLMSGMAVLDGDEENAFPITWKGPSSDCEGTVSIDVSAGGDVTIDWAPDCGICLLLVEPVASGSDMWSIYVEEANDIVPSITYGVAPAGAIEDMPAIPLVAGQRYEVILWRWVDGVGYRTVGYEEFVR
jgi:hypothetical protein